MAQRKINCYKDLKQALIAILVLAFFGNNLIGILVISIIIIVLGLALSNTIILNKGCLIRKNIFGNYIIKTVDVKEIKLLHVGPYLSPFRFQILLKNNEKKYLRVESPKDLRTFVAYAKQECIVFNNQYSGITL